MGCTAWASAKKKDWLGREKLSARMTGVSPDQIDLAEGAAILAWDEGRKAHVYIASALSGLEADGLTEVLDRILKVGWELHSSSLSMATVGPNRQQAMFVLVRP